MTASHDLVFLLDVDNTLLNNDQVITDLQGHLAGHLGADNASRYWVIFEDLRSELGYADYLGALQRYRLDAEAGQHDDPCLLTGTKDPAVSDTLNVEALAATGTINTIPEKTLLAYADHGKTGSILPADGGYAQAVLQEFRREGVDDQVLAARLQREGVQSFTQSWSGLMARIREKGSQPTFVNPA